MRTILFLLFIFLTNIMANGEEKAPCASSKKLTIAPIIIKDTSKKKLEPEYIKKTEGKLRTILSNVKEFKNKNTLKTNKLRQELNAMKKEFSQYKMRKNKELKKVKTQLYSSTKKLNHNQKELINIQKKLITRKTQKKTLQHTKSQNTKPLIVQVSKQKAPVPIVVHKIIRKMQPSPIPMYHTPWIEIIVENDIDIYELALKYYGDEEKFKEIYAANKSIIRNDLKIYNGMSLIIPMTTLFEEQGMLLNQ